MDVYGKWLRYEVADNCFVRFAEFPCFQNMHNLSVLPVDLVFKDRSRMWVKQIVIIGDDLLAAGSIVIAEVNKI